MKLHNIDSKNSSWWCGLMFLCPGIFLNIRLIDWQLSVSFPCKWTYTDDWTCFLLYCKKYMRFRAQYMNNFIKGYDGVSSIWYSLLKTPVSCVIKHFTQSNTMISNGKSLNSELAKWKSIIKMIILIYETWGIYDQY